jgi:hypothetical protein
MEIDWGEDDAKPTWDWCVARRVFGYFRPYQVEACAGHRPTPASRPAETG